MNRRGLRGPDHFLPRGFLFRLAGLVALFFLQIVPARAADVQARQIWQLLDYVAVDYRGAVAHGAVVKASEYAEMQEFAGEVVRQLDQLPDKAGRSDLRRQAAELSQAVADKAEADLVAQRAHHLAHDLQMAYPFAVAPAHPPDLQRGRQLYQAHCSSCHGSQGQGDGPLAASLNPKPIALADPLRARERSLLALHQIVSNGVPGTAMRAFTDLSDQDRWNLAYFAGSLAYTDADRRAGAQLWRTRPAVAAAFVDAASLTQITEAGLAARSDPATARALMAYLRSQPAALNRQESGVSLAQARLRASLAALRNGERAAASRLALSAYLDGFEPIEPTLALRNRALFEQIETAMLAYRALVAKGSLTEIQTAEQALQALLEQARQALAPSEHDAFAAFLAALTILVREGLEALLVVVGMLAFLKKAQRRDVARYVHAGWLSALAAGGLTWGVATYLVGISGASREMTEGLASLFSAVVLLGVGTWMHQKSIAGRWQIYLKQKLSAALTRRTAWLLFSLAFVAVYREVFETVLFYAALWSEGQSGALLTGIACGVALLALIAFGLLRTSARLPIATFFTVSSALVAVLAVVLAGKGMAALQEAGLLPASPIGVPRIELLGLYPSWQTVSAQLLMLLLVAAAFLLNLRSARTASGPEQV